MNVNIFKSIREAILIISGTENYIFATDKHTYFFHDGNVVFPDDALGFPDGHKIPSLVMINGAGYLLKISSSQEENSQEECIVPFKILYPLLDRMERDGIILPDWMDTNIINTNPKFVSCMLDYSADSNKQKLEQWNVQFAVYSAINEMTKQSKKWTVSLADETYKINDSELTILRGHNIREMIIIASEKRIIKLWSYASFLNAPKGFIKIPSTYVKGLIGNLEYEYGIDFPLWCFKNTYFGIQTIKNKKGNGGYCNGK